MMTIRQTKLRRTVTLAPAVVAKGEAMAARERRSLSNLLEVLIEREEARRMRAQNAPDTCASQHPEGQEET